MSTKQHPPTFLGLDHNYLGDLADAAVAMSSGSEPEVLNQRLLRVLHAAVQDRKSVACPETEFTQLENLRAADYANRNAALARELGSGWHFMPYGSIVMAQLTYGVVTCAGGDPQQNLAGITSATDLRLYVKHQGGAALRGDFDNLLFRVSRADTQPAPPRDLETTVFRVTLAKALGLDASVFGNRWKASDYARFFVQLHLQDAGVFDEAYRQWTQVKQPELYEKRRPEWIRRAWNTYQAFQDRSVAAVVSFSVYGGLMTLGRDIPDPNWTDREFIDLAQSDDLAALPVPATWGRLLESFFVAAKGGARAEANDLFDFARAAAAMPIVRFYATDARMKHLLDTTGVSREYGVTVFNASEGDKEALADQLERL